MLNSTSFTGSRCQVVNELRDPALECLLLLCERVVVDSRRQGQNQVWQQQQCGRQSVESWNRAKSTRISLVNRIKKEVYSHDRGQRSRSFQLPMLHSKQVAAAAALFPHFSPQKTKENKEFILGHKEGGDRRVSQFTYKKEAAPSSCLVCQKVQPQSKLLL